MYLAVDVYVVCIYVVPIEHGRQQVTTTDRLADECHGYDLDGNPVVRVSRKVWWAVDAAIRGAWWNAKTDVERECWRSLRGAWADCYS